MLNIETPRIGGTKPTRQLEYEVTKLSQKLGGKVTPEALLEFAETHPDSEAHTRFVWDDAEAGHEYRLVQARQILSIVVITLPREKKELQVTAYPEPRRSKLTGRLRDGYEPMLSIKEDGERRKHYIRAVLAQLNGIRKAEDNLHELNAVWAAVDEAWKRFG